MKKLKLILLFSLILTSLYVYIYIKNFKYNYIEFKTYTGIVTSLTYKENKTVFILDNKILVNDYNLISNIKLGDKVYVEGLSSIPSNNTNFNQFNYKNYLLSKKIYYLFTLDKIKVLNNTKSIIYILRNKINNRLNTLNNPYINALIFADNKLDETIYESYKNNGITHLFAISGMHISFISLILLFIINKIFHNKKISHIIVSIFLLFYLMIIGPVISALRSVMFYLIKSITNILNIKIRSIYILLLILIIFLLYNPFIIYNISFIYSFTISFSLLLFKDKIQSKNYIFNLFKVSLFSFLVSIPITINNTFEINILSPIINLIFIPYMSFIILPLTIVSFTFPIFIPILNICTLLLEKISLFISNYSFIVNFKVLPLSLIIIYYLLLIISIKKNKPIIIIYIIFLYFINYFNPNFEITFLDVKQGDSILLNFNYSDESIMIDTGGIYNQNLAEKTLIPVLKSKGIKSIKYLILTHGDFDHMGAAKDLVNYFKVDNVIFNCGDYNDLENELIDILNQRHINYYSCIRDLKIGKYKLEFLNTDTYSNENDNSNVIYLEYNKYNFLFMGDASITREEDILSKYNLNKIDFLKIGHHGSDTSSSENFINSIKPKYSLISVGKNNRYGHPKSSVLDILENNNSKIYRTDEDGSIEIKIKSDGYSIETCAP